MLLVSLVRKEEERFVTLDRPAECPAELVQAKRLLRGADRNRLQRIERVIPKEFETVAVKGIRAGC